MSHIDILCKNSFFIKRHRYECRFCGYIIYCIEIDFRKLLGMHCAQLMDFCTPSYIHSRVQGVFSTLSTLLNSPSDITCIQHIYTYKLQYYSLLLFFFILFLIPRVARNVTLFTDPFCFQSVM